MAETFTRPELNKKIYQLSMGLSSDKDEDARLQFVRVAKSYYPELSGEPSIKGLTDDQAATVYTALKAMQSKQAALTTPNPSLKKEGNNAEGKPSNEQHKAMRKIIFDKYGNDYKKIFNGLKRVAPAVLQRMREADVKNTYLPAFFNTITKAEAHKLIQRLDQINKGGKK